MIDFLDCYFFYFIFFLEDLPGWWALWRLLFEKFNAFLLTEIFDYSAVVFEDVRALFSLSLVFAKDVLHFYNFILLFILVDRFSEVLDFWKEA